MQQLIDQITQRTGIPEEKARVAVDTVVGYLKEHLPGSLGSQLDSAVSGEDATGGMAAKARGMFGGSKETS